MVFYRSSECLRQPVALPIYLGTGLGFRALLYRLQKFVESFFKQPNPVFGELTGYLIDGNANLGQRFHRLFRSIHVFRKAQSRMSVIAERIQRCRRNRVDRIRPDQFFHVENVSVGWILGAGARPKHSLSLGSQRSQLLPARSAEDRLIKLISQFSVCDRYLAQQALQLCLLARIFSMLETILNF